MYQLYVCMQACLEAGFQDYATLRQDPDLAAVRGAKLDKLLGRWAPPAALLALAYALPYVHSTGKACAACSAAGACYLHFWQCASMICEVRMTQYAAGSWVCCKDTADYAQFALACCLNPPSYKSHRSLTHD